MVSSYVKYAFFLSLEFWAEILFLIIYTIFFLVFSSIWLSSIISLTCLLGVATTGMTGFSYLILARCLAISLFFILLVLADTLSSYSTLTLISSSYTISSSSFVWTIPVKNFQLGLEKILEERERERGEGECELKKKKK